MKKIYPVLLSLLLFTAQRSFACEANFTWTTDGLTINLDASGSQGDISSWLWYINGDLFSDAHPTTHKTVSEYGEYQICLVVSTGGGCVDTFCQTVNVVQQNSDCAAHFSFTTDGLTIHLNGSESSGDVVSWNWLLNGDSFSEDGPETQVTVSEYGEYQVCLVIETASGCVDTLCQTIHVEQNNDCAAHFTWSIDGLTINVNGSESTGDVVSWHWYLDGDLFSDDGPEAHVIVDDSGEYQICLVIETVSGCIDTLCQTVHVEQQNSECAANFTWEIDGLTISLNGSSSTGEILHWSWYINGDFFSDAHPETHTTVDQAGTYEICLVIQADGGCSDTLCWEVVVPQQDSLCEANFTWDTDGFTINLDGSSSTGEILHWSWFINGDFFSDAHPETHIDVGESGTYEICLAIHADGECYDTLCQEVVVEGFQGDGYDFKMIQQDDGSIVLQVSSPEDGNMVIVLSELSGKKIFEDEQYINIGSSQHVLTFGHTLSSGIYLASLFFNGELKKTEKIALLK